MHMTTFCDLRSVGSRSCLRSPTHGRAPGSRFFTSDLRHIPWTLFFLADGEEGRRRRRLTGGLLVLVLVSPGWMSGRGCATPPIGAAISASAASTSNGGSMRTSGSGAGSASSSIEWGR